MPVPSREAIDRGSSVGRLRRPGPLGQSRGRARIRRCRAELSGVPRNTLPAQPPGAGYVRAAGPAAQSLRTTSTEHVWSSTGRFKAA